MDKPRISASRKPRRLLVAAVFAAALAGGLFWYLRTPDVRVNTDQLTLRTVTTDQFFEYINLTARTAPGERYFMDSQVSGNVERIFVESGARVRRGDTLLFIANADLELDVMQREGELIEQLNAQRQTRLLLDQNDFRRRDDLMSTEYQLRLRAQQVRRDAALVADSLLAPSAFEPTQNEFDYLKRRRRLLRAAYLQDSLARAIQLRQLERSEQRLLDNLDRVRRILDRRYVLAAATGQLADFNVQSGEAITSGQRLGEIYSLTRPILIAEPDEFYLDRISAGQTGRLPGTADSTELRVTKIYPTVENGRFRIELTPTAAPPESWTKGQSHRIRLFFGRPDASVLLASGPFYGSTGGHWVYRLKDDGTAEKTRIRLGRSNPDHYEVLEGLSPGDRVITSAYDGFSDYETLILD